MKKQTNYKKKLPRNTSIRNRRNWLRPTRTRSSSLKKVGNKDTMLINSTSKEMQNLKNSERTLDKLTSKVLHGSLPIITKGVFLGIGTTHTITRHLQVI